MTSPRTSLPLAALAALLAVPGTARAGKTLDAVKSRGEVVCGVNTSAPGFSARRHPTRCRVAMVSSGSAGTSRRVCKIWSKSSSSVVFVNLVTPS